MTQSDISQRVARALISAIDELNRQLPKQERLDPSLDTVLTGSSGRLDSLGLINFILIAEEKLEEEIGIAISLTDGKIAHHIPEVFLTLTTLTDYLCRSLERTDDA